MDDDGDGDDDRRAVDGYPETDYIVVASTQIDPKVDAATDSGFEIDQVGARLWLRACIPQEGVPPPPLCHSRLGRRAK